MAELITSLSPAQQARFAQDKLRHIYVETCIMLSPHKDFLHLMQEIILWRKMVISAVIYCLMEIFFWHLYTSNNTYITVISDIIFWLLLADGFWVIATRDRRWSTPGDRKTGFISKLRRQQKELRYMSLEQAITRDAKSLEIGESAPHEVMCLWIAKVIMLVDNIQLALRHWSQEQPYLFAVVTGTFGLSCVVVGYFFSGVTFLFLITNYFMLLPVFRYYGLLERTKLFIDSNYPVLAAKVTNNFQYIRTLLKPLGEQEFVGIQLDTSQPMNDDLLQLNQTDGHRDETLSDTAGTRSDTTRTQSDTTRTQSDTSNGAKPRTRNNIHNVTFNQHPLDSIAPFIPPSEGFPSITAFFNPEDSISLPSFPPNYSRQPVGYHGNQPHPQRGPTRTPQYQDSLSLDPFGSIDPLHDSFDEDLKHTIPQAPLAAAPSAPLEPPPPYFEPSPYFQSPLVNSTNAPLSSSTPTVPDNRVMDEEDSVNILRQRERNEM